MTSPFICMRTVTEKALREISAQQLGAYAWSCTRIKVELGFSTKDNRERTGGATWSSTLPHLRWEWHKSVKQTQGQEESFLLQLEWLWDLIKPAQYFGPQVWGDLVAVPAWRRWWNLRTTCIGYPEDLSNFGADYTVWRIVTLDWKRRRGKGRSKWAQHVQDIIYHVVIAKALAANKGVF
jgi:hypothetical protein